jgi:hypothetical protein
LEVSDESVAHALELRQGFLDYRFNAFFFNCVNCDVSKDFKPLNLQDKRFMDPEFVLAFTLRLLN